MHGTHLAARREPLNGGTDLGVAASDLMTKRVEDALVKAEDTGIDGVEDPERFADGGDPVAAEADLGGLLEIVDARGMAIDEEQADGVAGIGGGELPQEGGGNQMVRHQHDHAIVDSRLRGEQRRAIALGPAAAVDDVDLDASSCGGGSRVCADLGSVVAGDDDGAPDASFTDGVEGALQQRLAHQVGEGLRHPRAMRPDPGAGASGENDGGGASSFHARPRLPGRPIATSRQATGPAIHRTRVHASGTSQSREGSVSEPQLSDRGEKFPWPTGYQQVNFVTRRPDCFELIDRGTSKAE